MELATLSPWVIEAKAIRNDETEIELFLSIEDKMQEQISVYPNPAENMLFVEMPTSLQPESIIIFDCIGKEIFTTTFNAQKISINTEDFPEGIYFIEVSSKNGRAATKFSIAK